MKRVVSFISALAILLNTSFAFIDVSKNHWAYEAVENMQKQNIISGFYDNTFKPDDKITKEQFATIITNALELKGAYAFSFADVSTNRWSNEYIKSSWMYFNYIKRNNQYYFEPERTLTREEVAKTMVKALNIDTSNVDLTVLNQFSDRNTFFSENLKTDEIYIALAVENGIMKGKGGYFAPKDTLTRAEVAAIMYNVLGKSEENTILSYTDFDLLDYMPENENYMISPFSIKMAMMMAANGADGETQKEILNAFGIKDISDYNEFSKNIIKRYNNNEDVKLNVANSIWLNTDKEALAGFNENFERIIAEYFDGIASEVNNSNAVSSINNWCNEKTNGKIKEIIQSSDFFAALVNAIYFKGTWAEQFNEHNTSEGDFTDYDGNIVKKDFMKQTEYFNYYEDEKIQMVEMPYNDYNTSMYVLLRKNDEKLDIESALNNVRREKVLIKLPKFKVEFDTSLVNMLKNMEISKAFSPDSAEFKNKMFVNLLENAYISDVLHKTFIEIDENGTEAAAVTAVIMETMSVLIPQTEEIKEFNANRPFIYFIRDNESGAILFMGKIVK